MSSDNSATSSARSAIPEIDKDTIKYCKDKQCFVKPAHVHPQVIILTKIQKLIITLFVLNFVQKDCSKHNFCHIEKIKQIDNCGDETIVVFEPKKQWKEWNRMELNEWNNTLNSPENVSYT